MDNFNPNGHISQDGLYNLIHNDTTELERLEFSEHLSFCPQCFAAYTDAISTNDLENAPIDGDALAGKIIRKNTLSRMRLYLSTGFAAAAVIGFINMCLFSPTFAKNLSERASVLKTSVSAFDISEKLSDSINKISDNFEFKIFKEDQKYGSQKK